ncbi:MAG: hypothetical protein EHM53_08465 [Methanoregulaceae archaeon]|nr:MAG: hypothetical protein EHM53_08465 [Methanoregulaceae archaeon]
MQRTATLVFTLGLLLVASLLIAGCSSEPSDQTAQTGTTTLNTNTGALYTPGDVVRIPASSINSAWLIIGYDPATDTYERALIYPNTDGRWGYRSDTRTEKASRSVMEKVYTEVVTHISVSSVPVVTPTIITPEETVRATVSATAVSTPVPTAPSITGIIPDEGYAGTSVSIKNLAGLNFASGAQVALSHNASTTIQATEVRFISNKSLICTFVIPSDAAVGAWDVTVTNPDGKSDTFTNIFTVRRDTSVVGTTASTFSGSVPITALDPPFATSRNSYDVIITGKKFQNNARVMLQKEGKSNIEADTVIVNSDTQIRCIFNSIPSGSMGFWDIVITNPDATYGRWAGGLEIRG